MGITKNDLTMAAAGAIDPFLTKLATQLANKTPRESVLRSDKLGLALGVLKGFAESRASSASIPVHALIEKVTDFSDFFSGALRMSSEKQDKFVETFLEQFLDDARERLKVAKNISREKDRLHAEMELRLALVDLATGESTLHASPRFRRQTTRLSFIAIEEEFERVNNSLEERLEKRRNGRHTRMQTPQQIESSLQTQKGERS